MTYRLRAVAALALAVGPCSSAPETNPVVVGYTTSVQTAPPASVSASLEYFAECMT